MNKLKTPPQPEEADTSPQPVPDPPKKKKPSVFRKNVARMANGVFGIFDRNQIVRQMPFILFVSLIIIGYISNSYYAERMIREIDKTKSELKEKRAEYISTMSRLMYLCNQSEVAKVLVPYQIKESTEPPSKIFIAEATKK
jgi:hypothetical protein